MSDTRESNISRFGASRLLPGDVIGKTKAAIGKVTLLVEDINNSNL